MRLVGFRVRRTQVETVVGWTPIASATSDWFCRESRTTAVLGLSAAVALANLLKSVSLLKKPHFVGAVMQYREVTTLGTGLFKSLTLLLTPID